MIICGLVLLHSRDEKMYMSQCHTERENCATLSFKTVYTFRNFLFHNYVTVILRPTLSVFSSETKVAEPGLLMRPLHF